MPRKLRIHVPDGFYHVTLRGNHQREIFVHDRDRKLLSIIVARALEKYDTKLHAYCWMTNHLHFLLQAGEAPLGSPMRQIAAEFARAMQKKLETTGHFFERRYHAKFVDSDSYLLWLMRYIHLNPVQAGMVRSVEQHPWTSHHVYVGGRKEPWVVTDFVLSMFGSTREAAVRAYAKFVDAEEGLTWTPEAPVNSPPAAAPRWLRKAPDPKPMSATRRCDLDELIAEACARFEVEGSRLAGKVYDPYLVKVRAWIAHEARLRQVASLSAVARALGRDESSLRAAMRSHAAEVD